MSLASRARRKIARLRRLSWRERRLLLSAAFWLLAVDAGLRTVGFRRMRRWLGGPPSVAGAGRPVAAERRAEAESIARLVAVAAHHHLYPMTCLRRSLVLERLLVRQGIPAELKIGVRKGEKGFRAHAWVECGGEPLSEPEAVEERYASLELPSSSSASSRRPR